MTDDLSLTLPAAGPYALTSVKGYLTHDGSALVSEAVLLRAGVPFAVVAQEGRGGCDLIRPMHPGGWADIDDYIRYARDVLTPQGVTFEPEDHLTSLLLERWADEQDRTTQDRR